MATYAYQYKLPTYEYTGKSILCPINPQYNPENPLSSPVLVPAKCILATPPVAGDHQIAIASGPNPLTDTWDLEDDYRGEYYYLQDGTKVFITELGVVPPEGTLQTDPPNEYYTEHDGEEWIYTENSTLQEKRCDEVDSLRDSKFYEAFVYDSRNWDIRNGSKDDKDDLKNILAREAYANHSLNGTRVLELYSGDLEISAGMYIKGNSSDHEGLVLYVALTGGTWAGGNAEATLVIQSRDEFINDEQINLYSDSGFTNLIQDNVGRAVNVSTEKYPWSEIHQSWIDRDNNTVTFGTPYDFINFALAVHDHTTDLFRKAKEHKDAIRALGTEEAINNYDITAGW